MTAPEPKHTAEPWPEAPGQLLCPLYDYPRAKACVDALAGLEPTYDCPECEGQGSFAGMDGHHQVCHCHGTGQLSAVRELVRVVEAHCQGPAVYESLRTALERIKPPADPTGRV